MKIAIGSDHAGFLYKEQIIKYLTSKGIDVMDFGCHSDSSVDYPDFAHPVANGVETGEYDKGILLCGSGNGIAMTANKHQSIRAALCWIKEIAELARLHNDANVLVMPARYISVNQCIEILEVFIKTEFEGGRHTNRINKIACAR